MKTYRVDYDKVLWAWAVTDLGSKYQDHVIALGRQDTANSRINSVIRSADIIDGGAAHHCLFTLRKGDQHALA